MSVSTDRRSDLDYGSFEGRGGRIAAIQRLIDDLPQHRVVRDAGRQVSLAMRAVELMEGGQPLVTLIGRTKAGKSSFRYAITGEAREEVGRGDQRTTRKVIGWHSGALHYFDTPGVGAFRGQEDTAATQPAALAADLLVWIVSNDPPQTQTLSEVASLAREGAPLVVLVNHKRALFPEDLLRGARQDLIRDRSEHSAHLVGRLRAAGIRPRLVLHTHLGAAGLRWEGQDPEGHWATASGLAEAVKAIESEAYACFSDNSERERKFAALNTIEEAARRSLSAYVDHHSRLTTLLSNQLGQTYSEAISRIGALARQEIDNAISALETRLDVALGKSRTLHSPKKAAEGFLEDWEAAFNDVNSVLGAIRRRTQKALPGAILHLESVPRVPRLDIALRGNPALGRGVDMAKYGVELAFVIAALFPGGAAPTIARAGAREAAKMGAISAVRALGRPATRRLGRQLPTHKNQVAKRRASEDALKSVIDESVTRYRTALEAQMVKDIEMSLASYRRHQRSLNELGERLDFLARSLKSPQTRGRTS